MLDYITLGRLINEERGREIAAAARARLVERRHERDRGGVGRTARRSIGRALVRFGVWLAMPEARRTAEG